MPTTEGYNGAFTGAQIDEAIGQVRGKNLPADGVKFTDGETFQQKYDSGELTGPQGLAGPQGETGPAGQDGATGPAGADGEDGGYYKPAVDTSGNLTWTASKSGMPAVSSQNIRGPQGPAGSDGAQGPKGDTGEQGPAGQDGAQGERGPKGDTGPAGADGKDGAAATISVGTVTTGEAGTSATVTNSGTSSAAVFNFTIPRGAKGDKGDKGDTGPAGADGAQGPAGADGANGKSAYEYAVGAGYTGTEEELSAALASLGDLNSILDTINGEVI